jgi:hypothetical protein
MKSLLFVSVLIATNNTLAYDPVDYFDNFLERQSLDNIDQDLRDIQRSIDGYGGIRESLEGINRSLEREQPANGLLGTQQVPVRDPALIPQCNATEYERSQARISELREEFDRLSRLSFGVMPSMLKREDIEDFSAKMRLANKAQGNIQSEMNQIIRTIKSLRCELEEEQATSSAQYKEDYSAKKLPTDVPAQMWYTDEISDFVDNGYISLSKDFRPFDQATREEFLTLIMDMNGGVLTVPPATQSFDDVPPSSTFFVVAEEAAAEGWMLGVGSCYGTHPCFAKPNSPIKRAEAAALMARAFEWSDADQIAIDFPDAREGEWYFPPLREAAARCVLQGDGGTRRVRPEANMNKAEMVVMLHRVDQELVYPNCE